METAGDPFPSDWSPPPIEFLNPRPLQDTQAEGSEPQPADGDPKADLASQSQGAGSPWGSEKYINSLASLLQEKRQLVEKFAVALQDIPQVHPGEAVFLPQRHPPPCFLDASGLRPHSALEELFLNAPPSQQLSFLRCSFLSNLYLHSTHACPVPVLQWLLKLLAWPPDTSTRAFGLLWDLSVDDLFRQSEDDVRPWCPSPQEVTELLHSLGAQSPATYSRWVPGLLRSTPSLLEQQEATQEVALDSSLSNIYKFLTLCVYLRPGVYTDASLLGLMELLCRTGLDTGLRLLPQTNLQQLLLQLLECIREWPGKLPRLCRALSWVSDHHHNLQAVVQLFPDVTPRGRQLRSQLSLVVIARMLGLEEALPLWKEKRQLSLLSRLLGLMKPSALRQLPDFQPSPACQEQQPKASVELDHKVCYLCHSLLTLAGVVVSSQDVTEEHWDELQLLCGQLDRHISTHVRESPQAMHRTRLKDLATQTYVRWQELLSRCQPKAAYFSPWKDV
uniref:Coiled-coil SMC6 And NSE5 INteracting (CANIN) domain-containing protein n=1 Tax=Cavia porcellus TaxID=10141 RepID=H0VYM4_CAVPO